jgi:Tol biopolymer transport system component
MIMSARYRRTFVATVMLLAAIVALPPAVHATQPGVNGRIAFHRGDLGRSQIFTANPDLSHEVQLTAGSEDGATPAWSPDGSRIAFMSARSDPDPDNGLEVRDIYTMKPDGSDVLKITDSVGFSGNPSWSPDGRWLVFAADRADNPRSQGLYLIRSDGTGGLRRLTTLPATSNWQELARFSPDGSLIVFTEYRGGNELRNHMDGRVVAEHSALFTVRPDGTDIRQITPWGIHASDADWSPDGTKLVFGAQPTHKGNIGDVLVSDADGGHIVDLTQDHGATGGTLSTAWYEESFNPAWSPDGTKIIFAHASFTEEQGFYFGLQVMNADGSGRSWVYDEHTGGHQPDWGTAPLVP